MPDYKVTDTELTSIANAIRTKRGTQAQLEFPTGFISAIQSIPSGGTSEGEYITLTPASNSITITPNLAVAYDDKCYAHIKANMASMTDSIFTIPEGYKPILPEIFWVGYGGSTTSPVIGHLFTNGIAKFSGSFSGYRFFNVDWFYSGTVIQVIPNSNIVNSMEGGILIKDNLAILSVLLKMNYGENAWANLLTIPAELKPQYTIMPTLTTLSGYIRDTNYNLDNGVISSWRSNTGYDMDVVIQAKWLLNSAS